jgi:hypothetical protein
MPFKPRYGRFSCPTVFYLEAFINKVNQKGKDKEYVFFAPSFKLHALESRDWRKTWHPIPPPKAYKEFIEKDLRRRVVLMLSGFYAEYVPRNHYLGFVVKNADVSIYNTPSKEEEIYKTKRRFELGDLQLRNIRPVTEYRNGYLKIKLLLKNGEKKIGWIDEKAVVIFMFSFPPTAGTKEVWKLMYERELIKGASQAIAIIRGEEQEWPKKIMRAINNHEVIVGMNEEQVVGAMGPPQEVKRIPGPNPGNETLIYKYVDLGGRIYQRIYFIDGVCVKKGRE